MGALYKDSTRRSRYSFSRLGAWQVKMVTRKSADFVDFHARDTTAHSFEVFLDAWEEALKAYEHLLPCGVQMDDVSLARDPNYARLLRAGRAIRWVGGEAAALRVARVLAQQTPDGEFHHFKRLWRGLIPDALPVN